MKHKAGFSLLEVLVALAAAALVLAVALPQMRLTLSAARQAERQSLALLVAESKLAELALQPDFTPFEASGEAEAGLLWQASIQPAEGVATTRLGPSLWRLSVQVRDRSGETRLDLATLRLAEAGQ
ncbi:type II secretion system minor pseudopilin GspI [Ferrovibrio sp.]|uniref:type II secretion system minor pseudopilin GspI n=1 Tax=Ferrovibrio sp. TaxID=1917215 RepID=UPI001B429ED3|nr:type II secretion system minor pseudopilin GspI [Ferrovibrio sp.]MBP7064740.1 type II secretion system minor pseudopilin GspI [Ferrovibrio sp.]